MHRIRGDEPRLGRYVLYDCRLGRRVRCNRALHHAATLANELGVGLVVFDGVRLDEPFSSPRLVSFLRDGMRDMAAGLANTGAVYVPYIGNDYTYGALTEEACIVVSDESPSVPRETYNVPHCLVEDNGLLPLAMTDGPFTTAYAFRRFLHKNLREVLEFPGEMPHVNPITLTIDWAMDLHGELPTAPMDTPIVDMVGGEIAAQQQLQAFLERIEAYPERHHPDLHAASGLSPYLRCGHISSSDVVHQVLAQEDWSPSKFGWPSGKRAGWWGVSAAADEFLDQIVTWRELGFVEMYHDPTARDFASLPEWARKTLDAHRDDPRTDPGMQAIEAGTTYDDIWNAAQQELLQTGVMHNYLRMLWGKKILEWSPSPEEALERMFYLNDKYALDGRDPNSVSGIMWCLGKYDRAWGERDVFGKVRCMTSDATKKKLQMKSYLDRFS